MSTALHGDNVTYARSFSALYLSLFLIMLTFVVGALAGHPTGSSVTRPTRLTPTVRTKAIGTMRLNNLFFKNSAQIRSDKLNAISAFMSQHDVTLHCVIYTPRWSSSRRAGMALTVARSAALFRSLLKRHLPAKSLVIVASGAQLPLQAKLRFVHSRGANG